MTSSPGKRQVGMAAVLQLKQLNMYYDASRDTELNHFKFATIGSQDFG